MIAHDLLKFGSKELKSKHVTSHVLDAEVLLSSVLNMKREKILTNLNKIIPRDKVEEFKSFIFRRSFREPIAYILKEKEFWSKNFYVENKTLIPRPETELIVERLIKIYKGKSISFLDIGTGSGCILISLLSELTSSKGTGVDISQHAIEIAKYNSKKYQVLNRAKLVKKSFDKIFDKKFDFIVSNPPYIERKEIKNLDLDIKNFEPKIALDGGNDGLDLIRKVIYKARKILKINGMLGLEIGTGQFLEVSKILKRNNFRIEHRIKDYNDNIRCILSKLTR